MKTHALKTNSVSMDSLKDAQHAAYIVGAVQANGVVVAGGRVLRPPAITSKFVHTPVFTGTP